MMSQQFKGYQEALRTTGRSIPRLLIDLDILDQNVAALQQMIVQGMELRLVVKSLPSAGLVQYLQARLKTNRLMVFHQPFLSEISAQLAASSLDTTDLLLGKPMPVDTAAYYYRTLLPSRAFNPYSQVQWLVDKSHGSCLKSNPIESETGLLAALHVNFLSFFLQAFSVKKTVSGEKLRPNGSRDSKIRTDYQCFKHPSICFSGTTN